MIAIFLLDFGGPSTLKDVRPFLKNLFSDKMIFPFPFAQNFFAWLCAYLRAPKVEKQYALIGGGSPLPKQSLAIADKLEKALGPNYKVFVGMRYFAPMISEVLKKIAKSGPEKIIVIPMFPHYCTATTLSVQQEFEKVYKNLGLQIPYQTIDHWYDNPHYLQGWVESIQKALAHFDPSIRSNIPILFTAHSLPKSFVEKRKDPYPSQIIQCTELIMKKLGGVAPRREHPSYLSYQSKIGPIEWLKPSTMEFVEGLANKGIKNLVIVPISFLTDHIETLYEIDQEIIPHAKSAGIQKIIRCEALYYSPHLIAALKNLSFPSQ